ncbi:MAG: ComF family protein [Thermoanaerobaculia bacterium]|nr:ComF family protein [Thermoanaerobaculia bacterium]
MSPRPLKRHRPLALAGAAARALAGFVYPMECLACDAPLRFPSPPLCLCTGCRERLRPAPDRCPRCRLAADVGGGLLCLGCSRRSHDFDRLFYLWAYEPPAAQVILAFKFARLPHLAAGIGDRLFERLPATPTWSAIVPVPLHRRRRWQRGYDQAVLLAVALGRRSGLPVRLLLRRRRATPPQSGLGRKRRLESVGGAFRATRALRRQAPEHALLVDDVATTGATLDAAAAELKRYGVAEVTAAVAAVTPRVRRRRSPRADPPGGNDRMDRCVDDHGEKKTDGRPARRRV